MTGSWVRIQQCSSNQFPLGPFAGGLLCIQDYKTAATFLQLEARPSSRGYGCIQAYLDRVYRLCKPSMGADRLLRTVHPSAGSNGSAHHTIFAKLGMVPTSFSSPTRQSEVNSSITRHSNQPSGSQDSSSGKSQSIGRMVHHWMAKHMQCVQAILDCTSWQSYQSSGISDEASALLLALYGSSTTKTTILPGESGSNGAFSMALIQFLPLWVMFKKNLVYQFHQGKQYRSLNCYRSALSSVLAPIDGFDVCHHPLVCRILKGVFLITTTKSKIHSFLVSWAST